MKIGQPKLSEIKGQEAGCLPRHFQRSSMRMSQGFIQFKDELHKNEHLRETIEELKEDLIKKQRKNTSLPPPNTLHLYVLTLGT
jgi:hypothetical protein